MIRRIVVSLGPVLGFTAYEVTLQAGAEFVAAEFVSESVGVDPRRIMVHMTKQEALELAQSLQRMVSTSVFGQDEQPHGGNDK